MPKTAKADIIDFADENPIVDEIEIYEKVNNVGLVLIATMSNVVLTARDHTLMLIPEKYVDRTGKGENFEVLYWYYEYLHFQPEEPEVKLVANLSIPRESKKIIKVK